MYHARLEPRLSNSNTNTTTNGLSQNLWYTMKIKYVMILKKIRAIYGKYTDNGSLFT